MADELVWYVAYGSNLCAERLQRYLDHCDPVRSPVEVRPTTLPHRLFFAHESSLWTGGTAFVDPVVDETAGTLAVAWLVHLDQFRTILARENGRAVLPVDGPPLPMGPGAGAGIDERRYGLVLGCDSPDDRPAYTFTTPQQPLPSVTVPAPTYVDTIVRGLSDHHGLDRDAALEYLRARGALS